MVNPLCCSKCHFCSVPLQQPSLWWNCDHSCALQKIHCLFTFWYEHEKFANHYAGEYQNLEVSIGKLCLSTLKVVCWKSVVHEFILGCYFQSLNVFLDTVAPIMPSLLRVQSRRKWIMPSTTKGESFDWFCSGQLYMEIYCKKTKQQWPFWRYKGIIVSLSWKVTTRKDKLKASSQSVEVCHKLKWIGHFKVQSHNFVFSDLAADDKGITSELEPLPASGPLKILLQISLKALHEWLALQQ